MKQTVVLARPPVYDQCVAMFKIKPGDPVIFSWGDKIYNPEGIDITPELYAHEAVHGQRQLEHEGGLEDWWVMYLGNAGFRLDEERHAHVAEYNAYARRHPNRTKRNRMLDAIAGRLCGPLYGNLLQLGAARELIRAA